MLEPGRSADMSNVANTDSYSETSAVSVEPTMTQALNDRAHTLVLDTGSVADCSSADSLKTSNANGHYHHLILCDPSRENESSR